MRSFGVSGSERGQALLIIVLIMVVALTVGLSVATRSITNLRTTTEEANSAQALSAAEAGLERSLSTNIVAEDLGSANTASYSTSVDSLSGAQILLNNGNIVLQDEGVDLWFVPHTGNVPDWSSAWNGTINVYWASIADSCISSPLTAAAVELAVVSGDPSSPILTRYVYDPCGTRRSTNNFSSVSVGGAIQGKTLQYSTGNISIVNGLIARIIPLYGNTIIGIDTG